MDDLGILRQINYELMGLEYRTAPKAELEYPIFFVIGAPRSGTTLMTQVLAYAFRLGYITNIAARFWNAPTLGVRVSRQILGDDPARDVYAGFFHSDRGQTKEPGNIHEFGYFWKSMNWASPGLHQLGQIQALFDAPLVMKGIYPAKHIAIVREKLGDKAVFINVERPTELGVQSAIYQLGGDEEWFAGWELPPRIEEMIMSSHRWSWRVALRYCACKLIYHKIADVTVYLPNICSAPDVALATLAAAYPGLVASDRLDSDALDHKGAYRALPPSVLHRTSDYDKTQADFIHFDDFREQIDAIAEEVLA